MRNPVLRSVVLVALAVCALGVGSAGGVNFDVAASDPYVGYMNVFELPVNGGGYLWGSPWALVDLTATWSGNFVTLGPNHIGDAAPYWYIGGGAPGNPGNKIMEANMYVEQTGPLAGQTVTFVGCVLSNTLTPAHTAVAFVKDFAPDFSSFNVTSVPLPAFGQFSVSLVTVNDPGRHVQYGFQMTGPNVWVTDLGPFGSVTIGPELATPSQPTSWGRLKSLYK